MRSAAERTIVASGRSLDLVDQVDYRVATTPAHKDEIYNLRYRAYLREGAIKASADERVVDQFEDAPNAWTFGVYFDGELYSSIRISVLTSEWRMSPSVELFGDVLHPRLDKGEIFIDSTRFVADPDKARNFPELPYVTVRLGSMAGVYFHADYGLAIVRPNHVWAADITYIPMRRGFVYLFAVLDWASRRVLAWRLSNTLTTDFCLDAVREAITQYGCPEIFNTDQGCQFTSQEFTGLLKDQGIQISMDGKGCWRDNVFVERLWKSIKYEEVYLHAYDTVSAAHQGLERYLMFYNQTRPHQALDGQTPDQVYADNLTTRRTAA